MRLAFKLSVVFCPLAPYLDGELEIEALYWYNQQGVRYLTPEEQLARYQERLANCPSREAMEN